MIREPDIPRSRARNVLYPPPAAHSYDFDLVVIGGGPAGEKGAAQAAYFGHKVCLIEEWKELGGGPRFWQWSREER